MDPLTHAAAGALVGNAHRGRTRSRALLWLALVAGVFPDIDSFIGLGNPERFLIHHRGITHSLAGGAVITLGLAFAMRFFSKSTPFRSALSVTGIAVLGHIFLDWITSFGTQLLAPFSNHRFAADGIFIIDPLFTISLWILVWFSGRSPLRRSTVALMGLGLILAYPAANIGARLAATAHLEDKLQNEGVRFDRVRLSPEILTPLFWKVVVVEGELYRMAGFSMLNPGRPLEFEDFQKADAALMERLGARASLFRIWSWFAVYPVMERKAAAGGEKVVFSDLRFYGTVGALSAASAGDQRPFSLSAELDAEGRLLSYEYGPPRGARLIHRIE